MENVWGKTSFLILYLLIDWAPCIKNSFVLFRERSWTGIEFTLLLFFLVFYIRQFRHWKPCTPCKQYYLFRLAIVCMSKKFLNVCRGKHMWFHVLIYKDCVKVLNYFAFGFPFMFAFHVFLFLLFWQSIYLQSFCGLRLGNCIIAISLVPICESIMQETN